MEKKKDLLMEDKIRRGDYFAINCYMQFLILHAHPILAQVMCLQHLKIEQLLGHVLNNRRRY